MRIVEGLLEMLVSGADFGALEWIEWTSTASTCSRTRL
jgi:hypothetical protein